MYNIWSFEGVGKYNNTLLVSLNIGENVLS